MKFDVFMAFQDFLISQRNNLLMWASICLGLGSAIYFGLHYEPSGFTTASLVTGCIAFFIFVYRLYLRQENTSLTLAGLILSGLIMFIAIGFTAAQIKTDIAYTPLIQYETRPLMIEGMIDHREDQEGKKGTLLFLSHLKIEKWDKQKTPIKIRITVRQKTDVTAGDTIKVLVKLTPLSPPVAPYSYDFKRHYFFDSIGALGYALSSPEIISPSDKGLLNLETIRKSISNHIQSVVPAREAGIVSALMTGERAAITDEDWDALRASGLAHIISISGLHVAMVAAPVFFLIRLLLSMIPFIALRFPIKKIAAGFALLICCLYVGLVVPSVPTTRALLMTGIALIAIMLDRSPFSLRLVAFSAILVLLISPESIWSVSFQMSFAAVAALVALAEFIRPYLSQIYADAGWIKKGLLFVVGVVLTSTIASIATAPYSLYHFQQVASYSVLANTLSVPISGLMIMPMVIISFALMPFGLADWSLIIMGVGVNWLLDIAKWTAGLSGSVITTSALPQLFLVMLSIAGLTLILATGWFRAFALLPLIIAFISIGMMGYPDILISNEGTVIAIKDDQNVYLSTSRKEKFTTETWLKRWDIKPENVIIFPKQGQIKLGNEDNTISCDPAACRINFMGHHLSIGNRFYDLKKECHWADVIISDIRLPNRFCGDKNVKIFGYYQFKKTGALALSLSKDIKIETVEDQIGLRPWNKNLSISTKK